MPEHIGDTALRVLLTHYGSANADVELITLRAAKIVLRGQRAVPGRLR